MFFVKDDVVWLEEGIKRLGVFLAHSQSRLLVYLKASIPLWGQTTLN